MSRRFGSMTRSGRSLLDAVEDSVDLGLEALAVALSALFEVDERLHVLDTGERMEAKHQRARASRPARRTSSQDSSSTSPRRTSLIRRRTSSRHARSICS